MGLEYTGLPRMDELKAPVNELARSCARSADTAEWAEFLGRCAPVAALVAVRVSRIWQGNTTASVVDDIVQEVFLKLCEKERRILRDFKPQGEDSFLALLRVVAASVANDYFRRLRSEKRGGKVVTMVLDEESSSVVPVASERLGGSAGSSIFRARSKVAFGPWIDRGKRSNHLLALLPARPHRR